MFAILQNLTDVDSFVFLDTPVKNRFLAAVNKCYVGYKIKNSSELGGHALGPPLPILRS
jgi:hypothetical protein